MKYAGLTDDPDQKKLMHGKPIDWNEHCFDNETQARDWQKLMMDCGYKGGSGVDGWRYGYTYTITEKTRQ